MITPKLKKRIQDKYREVLSEPAQREWHAREIATADFVRQLALAGPGRLNDGLLSSILYDRDGLPGDFGQAWSHGRPSPIDKPFPAVRSAFTPLLDKVARGESISSDEFGRYRDAMAAAGVPPAVANRFAAACFPSQLAATLSDKEMGDVYLSLAADNGVQPTTTDWFERVTTILGWIKEAMPNTDDAWRAVLVWKLCK